MQNVGSGCLRHRTMTRVFGLRSRKERESGEKYKRRSLIMRSPHQMLGWTHHGRCNMQSIWQWEEKENA